MLSNLTVPVLNRYDLLQRMLYSIDYPVGHLMLIDNGGGITDIKVPDKVRDVSILSMPSNLGVATSWNLGIKAFAQAPVFYFSSADVAYEPGSLEAMAKASPKEITLAEQSPHWQTFAIGEDVVSKIGLFDESLYPIYFEDNDYERRAKNSKITISRTIKPVRHDNSSTIHSNDLLRLENHRTFANNGAYYKNKVALSDFSEGRWDLERRRINNWVV